MRGDPCICPLGPRLAYKRGDHHREGCPMRDPVTPEPVEALVERVRAGLNITSYEGSYHAALTELAERVKALQAFYDERIGLWHCTMEDREDMLAYHAALEERVKAAEGVVTNLRETCRLEHEDRVAAERERDEALRACHDAEEVGDELRRMNSGLTRDFNTMLVACSAAEAQRDELVEALDKVANTSGPHYQHREIARAALAKVRGEAE